MMPLARTTKNILTCGRIGMVVYNLLVGTWRVVVHGQPFFDPGQALFDRPQVFFHRRRRHHTGRRHKAAQREAAFLEEKAGLMADQQ